MKPEELREAGDWISQLKKILKQGPAESRNVARRPATEHRSTKKAVKLLLSNLREGIKKGRDDNTDLKDVDKVVFNAVDLLIEDKTRESKKNETKLNVLKKFKAVMETEFDAQPRKSGDLDAQWKGKINEALAALEIEEYNKQGAIRNEKQRVDNARNRQEQREQNRKKLELGTAEDLRKLKDDPSKGGEVLSAVDPEWLKSVDLDKTFGDAKVAVLREAVLALAKKDMYKDWDDEKDPELFSFLAAKVPPETWNDTVTSKQGLGPRVIGKLWDNGLYDEICTLIELGVDTTLPARAEPGQKGGAVYSGFVKPIQHITSACLRDIAAVDADEPPLSGAAESRAKGAKQILAKLGDKAATLTTWSEVKNSELVKQFEEGGKPGTIWGFEEMRLPYVQAAHETGHGGAQPVRMIELWEAVEEALKPDAYNELIDNPDEAVKKLVEKGVEKVKRKMESNDPLHKKKFDDVKKNQDEFIRNFEKDAKEFLLEFAAQMPKGTFTRSALDETGKARNDVAVSQVAGVLPEKFMGGLACKAGLWWAKKENKPVYYCLDGIKMKDVIDYKKVKNKAIEDFIDNGGKKDGAAGGHDEVITMVELREVLKHWNELKDKDGNNLVQFVDKGKIVKGEDLKAFVEKWQGEMQTAKAEPHRTKAPPKTQFKNDLKAIDPTLFDALPATPEGDMDARDIVKKTGYLVKVAKTRPEIVLKYIMSKCEVLTRYRLIPDAVPTAAARFANALKDDAPDEEIAEKGQQLLAEIEKCNERFKAPLKAALLRHPKIARGREI
jgi:hypothetical protein